MSKQLRLRNEVAILAALGCLVGACGSTTVPSTMSGRARAEPHRQAPQSGAKQGTPPALSANGTLNSYLAFALEHSPETRAAFERWRAARYSISRASRLPEPTISFGYFLRSVETRVGPQRYRLGVSQTFPWPSKLSASEDAAAQRAMAAGFLVDANVLEVRRGVAAAYWTLWLVQEEHRLKSDHDAILEALAGAVRGRLQTGAASLADLNQIDLNIARHHDHRFQHEEATRKASARLRAVVGSGPGDEPLRASEAPRSGLPESTFEELVERSKGHPNIERFAHLAASEAQMARAQRADYYPRLTVGLDLVGTGESEMPAVSGSGKDALAVSAGLSVPLWFGSYSDAVHAAEASSSSHLAMQAAGLRESEALLAAAMSDVRDAERRIQLYAKTLVPQADATFQAVLGSYQTGRSTVASVIIAQRDLIELQLEQARARADHARAWATLEFVVGADVEHAGEEDE